MIELKTTKELCDYGCGQSARYQFKNGKRCCNKRVGSCPKKREERRQDRLEFFKKHGCPKYDALNEIEAGTARCKICGEKANFVTRSSREFVCAGPLLKFCPKYGEYCSAYQKSRYVLNPDLKEKMRQHGLKMGQNQDIIRSKRQKMIRLHNQDPAFREKYLKGKESAKKIMKSKKMREHLSKLGKERFKDKQYRTMLQSKIKKPDGTPTSLEFKVQGLLQFIIPNKFIYNELDKFKIGRFAPDFYYNDDTLKLCILIHGEYWHSKKMKKFGLKTRTAYNRRYRLFYESMGYHVLIIWENELENIVNVTRKIRRFLNRWTLNGGK